MTYFVDSICGTKNNLNVPKLSERVIFRKLNLETEKPEGHSANKILRNSSGEVIAISCNCGKKIYHPATEDKVFWYSFFTKKELRMFREKNIRTEKLLLITEDF